MAKAVKKKTAAEASNIFHSIMGASVAGNPKPKNEGGVMNMMEKLRAVKNAVLLQIEDADNYLIMQIGNIGDKEESVLQLSYEINENCPQSKQDRITTIILKKAEELNIPVVTPHLPE